MNIKKLLNLVVVVLAITSFGLGSCRSKRQQSLLEIDPNCQQGYEEVDGQCVKILSLCTKDEPQVTETDVRVYGWGGLNVYRMFSDSCYNDAVACEHFKQHDCQPWVDSGEKKPFELGLGALGPDQYCCGSDNPLCDGHPPECDDGIDYTFKFIKCDGDVYMLGTLGGRGIKSMKLSCDEVGNNDFNPFKLGSVLALSQKVNNLFILTPEKKRSLVIHSVAAKSQEAGLPWADVPSINNFSIEFIKECINSLISPEAKDGAFCIVRNLRYGAEFENLF